MSTAGNLVFAGDGSNNIVALNATTGDPLWHAGLGAPVGNGPITYELDGTQYWWSPPATRCGPSRCGANKDAFMVD